MQRSRGTKCISVCYKEEQYLKPLLTYHRITHVDFELDAYIVTLRTETTSWRKSFHSMEIQMGHVQEGHVFRPKNDLRRRQDTIASTGALSFPTVTASVPNATSTASTNTLDVNHSLINKDLLPANSSLQVTCTNCSTYGTIDFSFAQFEFNDNIGQDIENTFTGPLELGDLFTGGEATIVAHGLGAHVELYTNISRTDEKNIDLFQIPLLFGVKVSYNLPSRLQKHDPYRSYLALAPLDYYMLQLCMLPTSSMGQCKMSLPPWNTPY